MLRARQGISDRDAEAASRVPMKMSHSGVPRMESISTCGPPMEAGKGVLLLAGQCTPLFRYSFGPELAGSQMVANWKHQVPARRALPSNAVVFDIDSSPPGLRTSSRNA